MLIEDTTNYEPTGETNESDIYLLQLLTKIANKKKCVDDDGDSDDEDHRKQ